MISSMCFQLGGVLGGRLMQNELGHNYAIVAEMEADPQADSLWRLPVDMGSIITQLCERQPNTLMG